MQTAPEGYYKIIVETYELETHNNVRVRPIAGQVFGTDLNVRCDNSIQDVTRYPLGTRFKLTAKLSTMAGGGEFLHSPHQWPVVPIVDREG